MVLNYFYLSILVFTLTEENRKWNSISTMIFTSSADFILTKNFVKKKRLYVCHSIKTADEENRLVVMTIKQISKKHKDWINCKQLRDSAVKTEHVNHLLNVISNFEQFLELSPLYHQLIE